MSATGGTWYTITVPMRTQPAALIPKMGLGYTYVIGVTIGRAARMNGAMGLNLTDGG